MEAKEFTLMAELTELYGALLTPKQRLIMETRFHQDYSLSEISEHTKISRSAVQDTLKKTSEKLLNIEKKLGFLKQNTTLKEAIVKLEQTSLTQAQKELIQEIKEVI